MDRALNQVYLDFEHNLQCLSGRYPENRRDTLRLGAALLTVHGAFTPMQLRRAAIQLEAALRQAQILPEASAPCFCALTAIGESGPAKASLQRSWRALKRYFLPSTHLYGAAALLAAFCKTDLELAEIAGRTKEIHRRFVAEHPFTATEREVPMCAAIALAGRADWEVRTADCASCLQGLVSSGKAARTISRILDLFPNPENCCQRFAQLWQGFGERGWKLAKKHQSALAVLAGSPAPVPELLEAVSDMAKLLKNADEAYPWNGTAKERLYLACLLTALAKAPGSEQKETRLAWFASLMTAVEWETWGSPALSHREIG